MIKTIYSINIINYILFSVGIFYISVKELSFSDLLLFFAVTSALSGAITLGFAFTSVTKVIFVSLIWFVIDIANILFLIPTIIFIFVI